MDLIVAFGHAECFEGELYTTVSGVLGVFLCVEFMIVFTVNMLDVSE